MANVGIYDMTDTWNNAGTAFTAIKMNVTDTASASGSKLLDVQKGGSSYLELNKSGELGILDKIFHLGDTNTAIRFPAADTVTVETAGSERLRITSSGNLGIGTTSPQTPFQALGLQVGTTTTAGTVLTLQSSSATSGSIYFSDGTTGDARFAGYLAYDHVTDALQLASNATERMRITSDGYLRMASGSGGIQFNGDTAAANALDDYEEGTWTPGIGSDGGNSGQTYSKQEGVYTKIGRWVYASFDIQVTAKGTFSAGGSIITGLPFNSANTGDLRNVGGSLAYVQNLGSNFVYQSVYAQQNANFAFILTRASASAETIVNTDPANFFSNSTRITGSVSYYV